jgi:hypothetical protein
VAYQFEDEDDDENEHELNHVHPNGKTRFHHGYQRGIFPSGSIGWMRVRRNRFSQCLTTAENFGSAISSKGFTRYSSSRDRVVERFPIPRVYDFFQIIFFPIKSAEPSAQVRSAALKMIRFRKFSSVTSAFSLVPSGGMKESLDCAAKTVVVFA